MIARCLLFLSMILLLSSCSSTLGYKWRSEHRHSSIVRSGILEQTIDKQAFIDVWGDPDRTKTISSEEYVSASWGGARGGLFKGKDTLEVWSYEKIGIELVFNKHGLVGWRTDRTVRELKAAAMPLPE